VYLNGRDIRSYTPADAPSSIDLFSRAVYFLANVKPCGEHCMEMMRRSPSPRRTIADFEEPIPLQTSKVMIFEGLWDTVTTSGSSISLGQRHNSLHSCEQYRKTGNLLIPRWVSANIDTVTEVWVAWVKFLLNSAVYDKRIIASPTEHHQQCIRFSSMPAGITPRGWHGSCRGNAAFA